MDLASYLNTDTVRRSRCPLCDARRGLSIDSEADTGVRTGLWHCFACGEGGDGASLYSTLEGVSWSEAMTVFGYPPEGTALTDEEKKRRDLNARYHEQQREKQRRTHLQDVELMRVVMALEQEGGTPWKVWQWCCHLIEIEQYTEPTCDPRTGRTERRVVWEANYPEIHIKNRVAQGMKQYVFDTLEPERDEMHAPF